MFSPSFLFGRLELLVIGRGFWVGLTAAQKFRGWTLAYLSFQATGVIYGDIGTSPLYVYSSTFTEQPSYDDLVGALSIIIWTLILMVSIKYSFIVLSADVSNLTSRNIVVFVAAN